MNIYTIFVSTKITLQQIKQYSETELVLLLKAKDQRAYNYLYDNYSGALYSIVIKILGNREEGVDILQESFIKIWKNIDHYDADKGRLFTWMLKITRNTAIDYSRSGSAQKDKLTNRLEADSPIIEQSKFSFLSTDHLGLNKVIDGLRNEDKEIVELAYFKGFTQQEIANKLAIPLGTVKTRARSALIKLKSILKTN